MNLHKHYRTSETEADLAEWELAEHFSRHRAVAVL